MTLQDLIDMRRAAVDLIADLDRDIARMKMTGGELPPPIIAPTTLADWHLHGRLYRAHALYEATQ